MCLGWLCSKGMCCQDFSPQILQLSRTDSLIRKVLHQKPLLPQYCFSMVGYYNGNDKTVWVMTQGLIQTLLVRLPFAYFMSIQPHASLTRIGLAAPVSTAVGIILNVGFYIYLSRAEHKKYNNKN